MIQKNIQLYLYILTTITIFVTRKGKQNNIIMKLKQTVAVSILAIAGLTSCEKDLYDPNQAKPSTKVEDLKIADDFDWQMNQAAKCTIESGNTAVTLSIYQDEACTPENLLATVPVLPGSTPKIPLSLLASSKNVYVQYQDAAGKAITTPVPVVDGQINFTAPKGTATRATTREDGGIDVDGSIITYYPSFNGGTVMFEDGYPEKGDYDFNDFVAYYMITVNTDPKTNDIRKVNLYMTVNAIGARKVYIPHFRLKSFDLGYVNRIEKNKGLFADFNPVLLGDNKNKIVVSLNGGENKFGHEYLNTEKDSPSNKCQKLDVTIFFNKGANLGFLDVDKFDIFLATANRQEEIHIIGNGPAFKQEGYEDKIDNNNKSYNDYYKMDKTNLVWGISIPARIKHAYERTDFLSAYPDFGTWAEGNYDAINQWYKNNKPEFIFPL